MFGDPLADWVIPVEALGEPDADWLSMCEIGSPDLDADPEPWPFGSDGAVLPVMPWAQEIDFGAPADGATRTMLESFDPRTLGDFEVVECLRAWQRQVNSAQARLLAVADELDRRATGWCASTAAELACALTVSRPVADRMLHTAARLRSSLPRTCELFTAGDISLQHAQAVAEETAGLDLDECRAVESLALVKATRSTHGQLRAATARAVAAVDPDGFAERSRARRRDNTDVHVEGAYDGMSFLCATAPHEQVAVIKTAVDAWADAHRTRLADHTIGQRRVDALVEWAAAYLTNGDAPTRHGRPTTVDVIVHASTLLGLDNLPGEIIGYGMIPAQAARQLAADSPLRRLIIDKSNGGLLDCGTRRYRADQKTRDFILARDRYSTFPGSTTPATRCDIDHTVPYGQGGPTHPGNAGPLDRRAHNTKTRGDWTITRHPDGTTTWTSPTGHTYRNKPHDYRLGP